MRGPMRDQEYEVDVSLFFHDESMSINERAIATCKTIRASRWWRECGGEGTDLADTLDELSWATTASEFDAVWNDVYDLANADRCWIATRPWMRSESGPLHHLIAPLPPLPRRSRPWGWLVGGLVVGTVLIVTALNVFIF